VSARTVVGSGAGTETARGNRYRVGAANRAGVGAGNRPVSARHRAGVARNPAGVGAATTPGVGAGTAPVSARQPRGGRRVNRAGVGAATAPGRAGNNRVERRPRPERQQLTSGVADRICASNDLAKSCYFSAYSSDRTLRVRERQRLVLTATYFYR